MLATSDPGYISYNRGLSSSGRVGISCENPVFSLAIGQRHSDLLGTDQPFKLVNFDRGNGSVGYYRTVVPFYYLGRMGFARAFLREHLYQGTDPVECMEKWAEASTWADIIQVNRPWNVETVEFMKSVKQRGKIVLLDSDDNLEAVSCTGVTNLSEFWNEVAMEHYLEGLEVADLITVASKALASIYEERWPGKVKYLPNPVDSCASRWNFPHKKHDKEDVVICWYAGLSHILDADMIADPMREIMSRYAKVHFKVIGYRPDFLDELPPDRVEAIEGSSFHEFVRDLADVDISLAPLLPHEFNVCRSDTKAFEPTMAGCAVIASPVGEMTRWEDGEHVLFASSEQEWVDSMAMLIEHPEVREELNNNAVRFLIRFRSAEAIVPMWYAALREALEKRAVPA